MESNTKFVRFDIWCEQCRFKDTDEAEEPCHECLSIPAREGTERPERFWKRGDLKDPKATKTVSLAKNS